MLRRAVDGAIWFPDQPRYRSRVDDRSAWYVTSCNTHVAQLRGHAIECSFDVYGKDGGVVGGGVRVDGGEGAGYAC